MSFSLIFYDSLMDPVLSCIWSYVFLVPDITFSSSLPVIPGISHAHLQPHKIRSHHFQAPFWVSLLLWTLPGDSLLPCPDALNKKPVKQQSQGACLLLRGTFVIIPSSVAVSMSLLRHLVYLSMPPISNLCFSFFHILSSFKNTISPASPFKFTTNPSSSDLHDVSLTIINTFKSLDHVSDFFVSPRIPIHRSCTESLLNKKLLAWFL